MVAFEVFDSVLSFAVGRLVEILHDLGARRFRSVVVRIHIGDQHCQGLGKRTEFLLLYRNT